MRYINNFIEYTNETITAYHGTPYKFRKFTTDKIGTGEGNQSFGWGLYFTDIESIAKDYAVRLSASENSIINGIAKSELDSFNGDVKSAIDSLENTLAQSWSDKKRVTKAINVLKNGKLLKVNKPKLYKVSLHKGKMPDQYAWLVWDKPVSNDLINKIPLIQKIINAKKEFTAPITGSDIYKGISKELGGDKQASLFLLENGIDGVKYPAESIARGTTSDNARGFNYVVFDENVVDIDDTQTF